MNPCLMSDHRKVTHLSHQKREALCCKLADVLLLVFQQFAVQTVVERGVKVNKNVT